MRSEVLIPAIFQLIRPSPRRSSSIKTQQRGGQATLNRRVSQPSSAAEHSGYAFGYFTARRWEKNNPNSCFYGVNSLSVDPRSAVGTETRETDVMWRSGAAGQLIKTRQQFTVSILYWRKYSAPHAADTLQTLHYKLKSATAFKQVHLSALCSKMSVMSGCSYMHQRWRSILLLELCTNQLL